MTDRNLDDVLAAEAADVEELRDRGGPNTPFFRSKRPPRDPAQVYSVRMPVDRLEELRRAAVFAGETPSGLMRRWVLERLDEERETPRTEYEEVIAMMDLLQQSVRAAREARSLRSLKEALAEAERAARQAS